MPDLELLKEEIERSPLKLTAIMGAANINNRQTWSNKMNGKTEFTISELQALCEVLGLMKSEKRDQIFFGYR